MTQPPVIIDSDPWLPCRFGRYLQDWEQAQLDRLVADIFGFHALQLGWPSVQALRANRMPHRWLIDARAPADPALRPPPGLQLRDAAAPLGQPLPVSVLADFDALPFPSQSLDLVVLPHTLEIARDPHGTLREVERVLMPEGRVVVLGYNPASLLGLRHRAAPLLQRFDRGEARAAAAHGELIGWRRLRDWLRLLGFEMEQGRFGCYRPPLASARWLERCAWMDDTGARWWPVLGSAYVLQAVKRVRGMRLIGPGWKRARSPSAAPAVIAQHRSGRDPSAP
jgi:SAM-dependent methyltransferase